MATSQTTATPATETTNPPATDGAVAAYSDNDIIIKVSGAGADLGYSYVLPAPKFPASLSAEHIGALLAGYKLAIYTPAQNAATKARKGEYKVKRTNGAGVEEEVSLPEREAVQHFISTWKPSDDRKFSTIGNTRMELARDMVTKALASRGLDTSEANVEANLKPWLAGPQGSGDNAKSVEAALKAALAESYKPTKRGAGKAEGAAAEAKPTDW